MEIREQRQGAVTVLRPIGPLVQGDADGFTQRLSTAAAKSRGRLVLDASAIPFADSAGLEALAAAADQLGQSGQVLKISGAGETLREVLDITDLSPMFEHFQDVSDATRSFL
jgi:anti-anti-sigma factor